MAESRDPAIKLFGKTIPLPAGGEAPAVDDEREKDQAEDSSDKEATHESKDMDHDSPISEEKSEPPMSSTANETPRNSSDQETIPVKNLQLEEQKNEADTSQEKTKKKPDKILPCPRCNSVDTKFCYYNNYNVNQPRYFCRNCQRYWTAGGTMRNVPVGAGRRKNKNSMSQFRHITLPDATFQTARPEVPEPVHHTPLKPKPNGTVLSFGSDTPLCESMASVLSLAEKTMKNCNQNGFHRPEEQMIPLPAVENGDEQSTGSSVTAWNSSDDGSGANMQEPVIQDCQGFPAQFPYMNGSPWPYLWSPVPAFCPSTFPMSVHPAPAYWGCPVAGTWNIPWLLPLAPSDNGSSGSGPKSPTLGKHSREGEMLNHTNSEKENSPNQSNQERCLWIPKTLRIDDPEEAAKSSIWSTLGFKNGSADRISGGGLFKAFHKKAEEKNHIAETAQVLHANPAALSRSLNFQESS